MIESFGPPKEPKPKRPRPPYDNERQHHHHLNTDPSSSSSHERAAFDAIRRPPSLLLDIAGTQYRTALSFYRSAAFHAPIVTIWVASFGGALHAPVTTFYYLRLGASEIDIGWLAFVSTLGGLILAPFYGWLLDRRSAFAALCTSCLMCSFGCLVRGLAWSIPVLFAGAVILGLGAGSLWTTVLSFISKSSPKEKRSEIVSGYLFQVQKY